MKDFFELREKAVSQQQQKLMGLALAYKRGEISADEISPQAKAMADKMSEKDLEDFAKTKHKGLPVKKEEVEAELEEAKMGDTGWKKSKVHKDAQGNVIKTKNVAKHLAKKGAAKAASLKKEEVGPDEATIKLDTKKLKVGDKVKTSKGTVEIVHRPTKRRGEDEFKMILHAKDGKKYDMGSHPGPSASAVQSIVSNSKLTRPMTEATKVPAGMKFIGGYVYKGGDGKDHKHTHYRKGTKMSDPVVVHIDGKEWKTFPSFTKAKQAAIDHIKGMKGPSKFRKEEQDPLLADENPVTENGQDFFELREKLSEQVLAHGGKGQYKAVKKGGVVHIMYKGKKVGTADYDSGADAYFASIKGVRGQKDFETAQDMVDYFAKNKITEARYYRGDRVKTMYKPPAPKMGDKSSSGYDLYHKSYSAAMQHAYAHAKKQGYEVDMDDVHDKVAMGPKKPSEGKTNSFLLKLKNEPKKRLSVQVYGMGGGKYELNTYITR